MRLWHSVRAVLALPGLMAVVVPALIIARTRSLRIGWGLASPWRLAPITGGGALIGGGLVLLGETVRLFHQKGRGTLAPWEPPRYLVLRGVYRHVRNPMISGVFSIRLGESLLLGSRPLLGWCAAFGAVNALYMPLVEEPDLVRRFSDEYRLYLRHVPRWLPRRRPWLPPWDQPDLPAL